MMKRVKLKWPLCQESMNQEQLKEGDQWKSDVTYSAAVSGEPRDWLWLTPAPGRSKLRYGYV